MKDKIKQEEACELKGYVKVQLFDAKTGKLKHEQEGENFITHATKATMKAFQARQIFMGRNGVVYNEKYHIGLTSSDWNAIYTTSGNIGPFRYIILTDDDRAENPFTQQRIAGNFLAWANAVSAYSGTSDVTGTININESKALAALDKISYVFDFPTNVANGTFQSIWFSPYNITSNTDIEDTVGTRKITARHIQAADALTNISNFFADSAFVYTTYSSNIYAQSLTTGEYVKVSTVNSPATINYICRDASSGLFYCARSSYSTLYVYNVGTNTWSTSSTGSPGTTQLLAAYGGYIYTFNLSVPSTLRRILATDNTQSDDWSLGLSSVLRACSVDATGYHFFTDTEYYKADTWGGTLVFQGYMGLGTYSSRGIWQNKIASLDTRGDRTVFYTFDLDLENATAASRKLLPLPITKTDGEVMKITYTFEIV